MRKRVVTLVVLVLLAFGGGTIIAQGSPVSTVSPDEMVPIPFPVTIALDGNLADWEAIPTTAVPQALTTGEAPAFSLQMGANDTHLYFALSIQSPTPPSANQSIELYLNLTTNLQATEYNAGIAQLIFTPPEQTNAALEVTGVNSDRLRLEGVQFITAQGWGIEAAIPLDRIFVVSECEQCEFPPPQDNTPVDGRAIGIKATARIDGPDNAAIALHWPSTAATSEGVPSPATFGHGVYVEITTNLPTPSPHAIESGSGIDWGAVREALSTQPASSDTE